MNTSLPAAASAITIKLCLLPEERTALRQHLTFQAHNPGLPKLAREISLLAAQALGVASRNVALRRAPEVLRALILALEAAAPVPVAIGTIGHQARARGYVAGTIKHELARRGLPV